MPYASRTFDQLTKLTINTKPRGVNLSKGFTLIELLVVLGILVIGVGSTLLFLTSILRGTNQANVTAEVKQNGQAILDSLERQIRNATDVNCLNQSGNSTSCADAAVSDKYIKLIRPNENPLHIKCFASTGSLNGWMGVVVSTSNNPSDSSYTTLTNSDTVSGVDIQSCSFKATPSTSGSLSPALVNVSFVVNQGIKAPSRADFLANAKFETTISLRKY
ncbi:hypothetical protein A2697_03660 [Candidatus Curtissbacteria bacterium RIFCSPHIGHO2_01_FULL_41_44]|uniref:Prepilin-type N-terminal cleavage/methylation domain-containing protein n=1 Tax=Candidatus Curtissbacteria bacterium RIFCSPLOWO2_01_FULL_42_50 TaxID=1797730 RepID=A0A1F5H7S0_9BACT|nr:MAG: hypothetical protein A2697_03660 [Candidatus Curtissbacteria bacterium RIFCSPHIGHO2_01_FULL_41_44]OGD94263.1 MAG: hypothetical protein A3C33_02820 [Candidatus Curtissbacteria bacterium RIFCSPHIGHO2_02_FULL_42_58]OGD97737.1 MAG: hypothetical protein A3E71_03330 [Candidatus Curtissbacteria bacterium RIFCSPHIGHO2_12_FULL_42_33]OGE00129.1 MAG: hypothetical protein A3B54_01875 [Candidatus Curtissbacteria bacterium RIFCSPLOWO2_01_FULL_42_50]OGE02055.1 MAG: hypothetical protein A3G16_00185 [Ca